MKLNYVFFATELWQTRQNNQKEKQTEKRSRQILLELSFKQWKGEKTWKSITTNQT